jgi:putative transposase
MFITLRGEPYLLWRAVDEHGAELDILVQKRRDKAAAKRCFKRAALEPGASKDRHRSVAQLSGGKSRDPGTCECEARVRQSSSPTEQSGREQPSANTRTQASHARLSQPETHTKISLLFRSDPSAISSLKRHLLRSSLHRKQFAARFVTWRKFTELAQNPSLDF